MSLHKVIIWLLAWFAVTAVSARAANWKIDFIDRGGGGTFTTLLMDKAGNAHVSYVNDSLHQLKYAFWDHAANKWFVMVVDNRCSGFSSMALDSHGYPHVSYLDYGTNRLKYAHFDGKRWTSQVMPIRAKSIEFYTSIALDADDHPAISFYETVAAGSDEWELHLRYIRWNGNLWEVSTIDRSQGSGKFNAIAITNGHQAVAYANVRAETASLRYADWDGRAWDSHLLEGADRSHPVYSVNMVLDESGTPHIAYTDISDRQSKYVKYATRVQGRWRLEIADGIMEESYPDRNGIALDAAGTPYITYFDAGKGYLNMAFRGPTKWQSEIIDEGSVGYTSSIRITLTEILVVYFDPASNSLKFARRQLKG